MGRKPKPQPDDPEQSKRFVEAAHEAEAAESDEAADRAFRLATKQSGKVKKSSD
jgi:hypothetical protein